MSGKQEYKPSSSVEAPKYHTGYIIDAMRNKWRKIRYTEIRGRTIVGGDIDVDPVE